MKGHIQWVKLWQILDPPLPIMQLSRLIDPPCPVKGQCLPNCQSDAENLWDAWVMSFFHSAQPHQSQRTLHYTTVSIGRMDHPRHLKQCLVLMLWMIGIVFPWPVWKSSSWIPSNVISNVFCSFSYFPLLHGSTKSKMQPQHWNQLTVLMSRLAGV